MWMDTKSLCIRIVCSRVGLWAVWTRFSGCRALTLLMDAAGHPLLVVTARGDQHLTTGLPTVVERYEQVVGKAALANIIVDREGMSGAFLKELSAERTVITLLRSDQYRGLDSFSKVGDFIPLELDRDGKVLREVAPAQFTLSIPEQPGETLLLSVALIRDWRKSVPLPSSKDERRPVGMPTWTRKRNGSGYSAILRRHPRPSRPCSPNLFPSSLLLIA